MEDGKKQMEAGGRRAKAARAAVILALALASAAAVVFWAFLERPPQEEAHAAALARRADFCEYVCSEPAPIVSSPCSKPWVPVKWVMEDSGCPKGDGACWTNWAREDAYGWYECAAAEENLEAGRGTGDPPGDPPGSPFRPYTIEDPRVKCSDQTCVEKWAAGTWYVNAQARPVFPKRPRWDGRMCVYECVWTLDPSLYYWFFGERGDCYACSKCVVPPTPTPWATPPAPPPPTECLPGTPTPPQPTPTLPDIPPLPGPPTVKVQPLYYTRDPRRGEDEWEVRRLDRFYWLWQLQLYIVPWAEVTYVGVPAECRLDSYEVTGIWVEEVGPDNWTEAERQVCPSVVSPNREVNPKNTIYAPEGRGAFCGWREGSRDYAMRLLWSREKMTPTREHPLRDASLNQYSITPWTQSWVLIRYRVRVHVEYTCSGFTTTAVVYGTYNDDDVITLRVGLVKPVRQYIPPGK